MRGMITYVISVTIIGVSTKVRSNMGSRPSNGANSTRIRVIRGRPPAR